MIDLIHLKNEKLNEILTKLYSISENNNLWWDEPLVNFNQDGELILEWWNNQKKLTMYINNNIIDYIKVWGADMDTEMESNSIDYNENLTELWIWLSQ